MTLPKKKRYQLKAGAMMYALFVMAIATFLTGTIMMFGGYTVKERSSGLHREQAKMNLDSGLEFLKAKGAHLSLNKKHAIQALQGREMEASVTLQPWGLFLWTSTKTQVKTIAAERHFLMGYAFPPSTTALYLADRGEPLFMGGKASIEGKTFLPKKGVQTAYVDGQGFQGQKPTYYNLSERQLPQAWTEEELHQVIRQEHHGVKINELPDSAVVSFSTPHQLLASTDAIFIQQQLKGNMKIVSSQEIRIASGAKLENVLLEAPIIIIEKGFSGNAHLIASEKIILEKQAELQYPSSILLVSQSKKGKVVLREKSFFNGPLMAIAKNDEASVVVELLSQSVCAGTLYVDGALSLKGELWGTVYCRNMPYRSNSTAYSNMLWNTRIVPGFLPPSYVGGSLEVEKKKELALIQPLF